MQQQRDDIGLRRATVQQRCRHSQLRRMYTAVAAAHVHHVAQALLDINGSLEAVRLCEVLEPLEHVIDLADAARKLAALAQHHGRLFGKPFFDVVEFKTALGMQLDDLDFLPTNMLLAVVRTRKPHHACDFAHLRAHRRAGGAPPRCGRCCPAFQPAP